MSYILIKELFMLQVFLHSNILSQIFGLYMVIMAVILLSRVKYYRELVYYMEPRSGSMFMGASFGLMLGLFLVIIHNVWVMEPRVVVTVISWLILAKSILWLSFPECMTRIAKKLYGGAGYYLIVIVLFIFGVFLLTRGFYMHIPTWHLPF